MSERDDVIERAYEAAFVPDLWPEVLDRVAVLSGTEGGVLFVVPPRKPGEALTAPRWTSSERLGPTFTAFVEDGWIARNERTRRAMSLDHAGFVNDLALFTREEIEVDPFYGWAREQGYGWCVGTTIHAPSGDTLIFD